MSAANTQKALHQNGIEIIPLRVFAARHATFDFIQSGIPAKYTHRIALELFARVPLAEHGWTISDTRLRVVRRYWGRTVWRATRKAAA